MANEDIQLRVGEPSPSDIRLQPLLLLNGWFQPFSDPIGIKSSLSTRVTATAFVAVVAAAAVTSLDWLQPLSDPPAYQVERGLSAAWQQYYSGVTAQAAPAVTVSNWFNPLSDPQPPRRWLSSASQQFYATDWKPTAAAVTYVQAALSEPVRAKPQPPIGHQSFTTDWKWTAPSFVPNWHRPFSEPVRAKQDIRYRESFTTDWKWAAPSFVSNWYQPFSEPVRVKQRVSYFEPFAIDWKWTAPSFVGGWYRWLSEPVRFKRAVAYQQPFTMDWKPAVVVTFIPLSLSTPVRTPPGLTASTWMQSVSRAPAPVTYFTSVLSEPVRSKKVVVWQQPFTTDWRWAPPVPTLTSYWFNRLSEPVQRKKAVAWQQPFTTDWKWVAPPLITDLRNYWFRPLAEPVRFRQFPAADQQFFTMDWQWTPPVFPHISYTLSVTEMGDRATLSYFVSSIVVGANVTISEIRVGDTANVTISEIEE